MAGAVIVIQPRFPQRAARETVQLHADGAFGKRAVASAIWPFKTRVKRSRISSVGFAHHDGAGDVGGAVEDIARPDPAGTSRRSGWRGWSNGSTAVMHDGAVAARARNGVEGHVAEHAGGAAETFQLFRRVDLGQLAARRIGFKPGQEPRQRRAVADMRLAHAFDFEAVLAGLGQLAGVVRPV